ncbi:MAG: PIN domain-containing protein [Bacteroidota bacterium]
MKQTSANIFLDSNVCIYLFAKDAKKAEIAFTLMDKSPIISTQVIAEATNVFIKKLKFSKQTAFSSSMFIMNQAAIVNVITPITIQNAFAISLKNDFSFFDSLIIASALDSNCDILYSEDLQHQQKISFEKKHITIINPFI